MRLFLICRVSGFNRSSFWDVWLVGSGFSVAHSGIQKAVARIMGARQPAVGKNSRGRTTPAADAFYQRISGRAIESHTPMPFGGEGGLPFSAPR